MSTFRLEPNGTIYLYHWITPKQPFKFSTGLKIEPKKWNKEKMRPKSPNTPYEGINITKELIRIEGAFHEARNHFALNGGFSPIKLRSKFKELLSAEPGMSLSGKNPRFIDFFTQQVEEYKEAKKSNWKGYYTTLIHLKEYFGRNIPNFEDIDMAFYVKYNKYLNKKELGINTISNHWKFIKVIMKQALYLKHHNNTEYLAFKRTQEESETVYLSLEELDKVYYLKLTGYLAKARDYFIIGCYTGLRFSDWDRVKLSKIKNDVLSIRITKTGELSNIRIHQRVLKTFEKYPDGVLPPKPANQNMNDYIKQVIKKAGIDELVETRITKGGHKIIETRPKYELVTTHTARRSFASNLILAGEPAYLIMQITGHKSLISFEKYVRIDDLQAADKLKDSKFFNSQEIDDEERVTTLSRKDRLKLLLLP